MLTLLRIIPVILRKGLVLAFFFTSFVFPLLAQEFRAIELDLEAEEHEKRGEKQIADEKRARSTEIRKKNFSRSSNAVVPTEASQKHFPPYTSGNHAFLGGNWEIGFRGNVPSAFFKSGKEWAFDNKEVIFQNGSPYLPRSVIPYQNESALPYIVEKGSITSQKTIPTLQLSFIATNKKWGFEYSNLPLQGTSEHLAFDFNQQFARYNTNFQLYDHRFMFKIYEELDQERWFTWDFGMRTGGWQTESSYLSPTLNQAGDLKESARFLAPSAGFRLYQSLINYGRFEFGSDFFYTPLAALQYERRFVKDGIIDPFGNSIPGYQAYKVESSRPLEMQISGFDLNLTYSFVLMDFHRFSMGAKASYYTWSANESKAPNFTALSSEALGLGIMNWYTTSAFYEADGEGKRASRYISMFNYFIGYNYVF